jgi:3-deoxy-D-manno-octulosonic-acid transferase
MRRLYTLLFYLAMPLVLARLYWRGQSNPDYRRRWRERFGFCHSLSDMGCICVHGVSVGEVRAALPLLKALQKRYPKQPLLVTTTTPTGSRQVIASLDNQVQHVYLPFDLPGSVRRFVTRAKPQLVIIMETELWPNLFYHCARAKIPLIVANARLSEQSAQRYRQVAGLTHQLLGCTSLIAAQTKADAIRFRQLGAPHVQVMGSLKYEMILPDNLPEQGCALRRLLGKERPIWIAASTHAGEEVSILEAFRILQRALPKTLLLWVPRHPERFKPVAKLCQQHGLKVIKRSENRPCDSANQVFLGDSMGELLLFYAAADVAFVGGSLVPIGGHNVLEPALLGLPLVFGPHMFHFLEASRQLLKAQTAWQVTDAQELARVVEYLLRDPTIKQALGQRSIAVVTSQRGALQKLLGHIGRFYGQLCD